MFDGTVKNVNKVDVAYVEEELGVLESIGEKIGLDLTGDLEKDFDALNEYPGKLDEMLEKIEKLIEEKMQELKNLENEQARLIDDEKSIQAQLDKSLFIDETSVMFAPPNPESALLMYSCLSPSVSGL